MDIAVIKSAQNSGTWEGQHGTMYVQEIELSDGRVGQVNAKTPNRWCTGDKVEVKRVTQSKFGDKFQLGLALNISTADVESGNVGNAKSYKFSEDREQQITSSWAIGQAIAMGYTDGDSIKDAARKLIVWRDTIVGEMKQQLKVKDNEQAPVAAAPAAARDDEKIPF